MKVPFVDIPAQNRSLAGPLQQAIDQVISEGRFILGEPVRQFEQNFAHFIGVPHCVGLNSGTSALHLALLASDIGPGDEVITTSLTWISTSWAISYVGAEPVFVDIDPVTYNIDPERIEQAVTPRTRALLPVHLYGQAADLERLCGIALRHNLNVIEDAA